jgi:predicted DNA-binding transcriptional regulator YafY
MMPYLCAFEKIFLQKAIAGDIQVSQSMISRDLRGFLPF